MTVDCKIQWSEINFVSSLGISVTFSILYDFYIHFFLPFDKLSVLWM